MRKLRQHGTFIVLVLILVVCFPTKAMAAGFAVNAWWDGQTIKVKHKGAGAKCEYQIRNSTTGDNWTVTIPRSNINERAINTLNELGKVKPSNIPTPKEGEVWRITATSGKKTVQETVRCSEASARNADREKNVPAEELDEDELPDAQFEPGHIPIFMHDSWEVIKFWYYVLASLSGAMIFLVFIRSGYQHMLSPTSNPGLKASFVSTLERCVIGLVVIMTAPLLISFLIQINDAIVYLCANTLDQIITPNAALDMETDFGGADINDWIARIIAYPFEKFNELIMYVLGLHSIGDIVFNGNLQSTVLSDETFFLGGLRTANPFTQALLNASLLFFTLYFNAVYTIRRWVVIAILAVTPIVIWIWVLSSQRNVIEIWLSEIFQTIFMQTWHALTIGIFFSILCFKGGSLNPTTMMTTSGEVAELIINIGKIIAAFGGVICVGVVISSGFKLATVKNEQEVAEVKDRITKSITGLIILGLALMIASFLASNLIPVIDPGFEEQNEVKVTFWQLFWVLFTIIPVSKSLSMIFMSLLSRFGTVDEHAEARWGLGMIAGIGAIGRASSDAARNKKKDPFFKRDQDDGSKRDGPEPDDGGSGSYGGRPGGGSGGSGPYGGSAGGGEARAAGLYDEDGRGYSYDFADGNANNIPGSSGYRLDPLTGLYTPSSVDQPSDASSAHREMPGIYDDAPDSINATGTTAGLYNDNSDILGVRPGIYDDDGQSISSGRNAEILKQESHFADMLQNSQDSVLFGSDQIARGANRLGYLGGAPVGFGQVGGTILKGAAQATYAPVRTALELGIQARQNAHSQEGATSITGRETKGGAAAQTLTAIALSPFGAEKASKGAISVGRAIDKKMGGSVDLYN